jgi:hypothetical protein
MVDFRYHLVSIVAVFLALGVGILLGSAFLGDPLVKSIRTDVQNLSQRNQDLRSRADSLTAQLSRYEDFAQAAEPWLVGQRMLGHQVVIVDFDGTDGDVLGGVGDAVSKAGGAVASTLTFSDSLSLSDPADVDQLALLLGSPSSQPSQLRSQLATTFGSTLGRSSSEASARAPKEEAGRLVEELDRAGFLAVDKEGEGPIVPPRASFIVVSGSPDRPSYDVASFVIPMAMRLDPGVLVAEPEDSRWNVVSGIRDDGDARNAISTVDDAETTPGRIAIVLGVMRDYFGETGQYGVLDGSTAVIPEPPPSG